MQYMGWSYLQMLECPTVYLKMINKVAQTDRAREENAKRGIF